MTESNRLRKNKLSLEEHQRRLRMIGMRPLDFEEALILYDREEVERVIGRDPKTVAAERDAADEAEYLTTIRRWGSYAKRLAKQPQARSTKRGAGEL